MATIFVDSIFKHVFVNFQHSTSAKERLKLKHKVERDTNTFGFTLKPFCSGNGIFKVAHCLEDL